MKSNLPKGYLVLLCLIAAVSIQAQTPDCKTSAMMDDEAITATVFFNYGSVSNAVNTKNRASISVGEPIVYELLMLENTDTTASFGFFNRFLLPPIPPVVQATQGDLNDRIKVSWQINSLGAYPGGGFNIYRDNVFLETVGPNIRNYFDFNIIAGQPYNYTVRGINLFGEGPGGSALGFMVPNGVVTGWLQSLSGNPVPDAMVTLMPMQGFSLGFDTLAGAFAMADTLDTGETSFLPRPNLSKDSSDWSITFWIKTDTAEAEAAILELEPFTLYLRPLPSADGAEGIAVATSFDGDAFLKGTFPDKPGVKDSTKNDWHHVALTLQGDLNLYMARLYIDGLLVDRAQMATYIPSADILNVGRRTDSPGRWKGCLDELRIYHRRLNQIDLGEIMMGTASSQTPGLKYYWKMDEEQGTRSFDIIRRNKLYFCGADFKEDRPHVRTSGTTNADGFYVIEGVSYGTGTTFKAEAMKCFYMHRALEFMRQEEDYITLPNFPLTPKATLELWLNNTGPAGTGTKQVVLSKQSMVNDFQIYLTPNPVDKTDNDIVLYHNGLATNFGPLGMGYQHLTFTIDSAATTAVTAYKNGVALGTAMLPGNLVGNWADTDPMTPDSLVLGARGDGIGGYDDFYDGLIDEIAVYNDILPPDTITVHAKAARNPQSRGLQVYFALDEGSGDRLNNSGSYLMGPGMANGTSWSPFAANQETRKHEFSPATRQVTLNPSVTSVDQVDFTDRSLITVSGYVRYANTDCFAEDIEILVNDKPYSPQIFTDSTGRFSIDFDPGTTAKLTPKFADHDFEPKQRFVNNVNTPIAGLLFSDTETRTISGRIKGGSKESCEKSIIDGSADCRLTVRTVDGCFERVYQITDEKGIYNLKDLPPIELTIAISKHNHPDIYPYFQNKGGSTIDLSLKDTAGLDFIYIGPVNVEVTGFNPTKCDYAGEENLIVLAQDNSQTLTIKVYEQYGPPGMNDPDERCYLDTAALAINNTFDAAYDATAPKSDSLKNPVNQTYTYKFFVENPNPIPPHLRLLQITADVDGRKGTYSQNVLVTGIIKGPAKFTTSSPMLPMFILRDPPGDGSSAFIEKGRTFCTSISTEKSGGGGLFVSYNRYAGVALSTILGFSTLLTAEVFNGVTEQFDGRIIRTSRTSMDYCLTTTERFSTDDGDLIVGDKTSFDGGQTILAGNDVYVGAALNFIFSDAIDLKFIDSDDPDPAKQCLPSLNTTSAIESAGIPTTYIYSEWNIENNVIRYLDSLILDLNPNIPEEKILQDSFIEAQKRWTDYIKLNKEAKKKADPVRNISWDAGVQYEFSETRDTSKHVDKDLNEKFEEMLGGAFISENTSGGAIRADLKIGGVFEGSFIQGDGDDTTRTWTTGYTLKDDDPGDTWTMDVKDDPLFKTPVFEILAGQSSCPWEVGTANREGVSLTVDESTKNDVPSNGVAVFHFDLGNVSGTGESWTYGLTAIPESNPDGAVIKLNGAVLTGPRQYIIPYGESVPVTVTVERGPEAYNYENLQIALVSECEFARNQALSFPVKDSGTNFYSVVPISVFFTEPCSEVDISFPLEGWVVKPDKDFPALENIVQITVYDYDLDDDDLLGIRLQYRPSDGNGAWINITDGPIDYIPKDALGPAFTQYDWDTDGTPRLPDGPYEIRAVSVCSGGPSANNGISHVIKGRIEREPPHLIGTPQPSDGVYQVGDEISFTFNKEINCDKLNAADITQPNNVGLYDAVTDQLIDIEITCYENKIIITPRPEFKNEIYENRLLRLELHDIQDLIGNSFEGTRQNKGIWEFYVDRNELAWLTDSIGMTKFEDQTKTVIAKIHNRGGYPVPFKIKDLPAWVRAVPDTGVIVANEIRDIRFEVDSSLAFGLWTDTITLHTVIGINPFFMGGDERLPLGVRVVCRPPDWDMDAGLYQNSMNLVLKPIINGKPSKDVEDIVAAYIGNELRGRAYVEYVPQVNQYLAYLTVYGEAADFNLPVHLEVWDASECLRYGSVAETFNFGPDVVVGIPNNPQVINTNNLVLREIPLGNGWNWISFNLKFPDSTLNAALASLQHPENDLIRSQTQLSTYFSGMWPPPLLNLVDTTMYIYRADQPDTLKMLGQVIDPATKHIHLKGTAPNGNWNWIGYIPNYALPINTALSSLQPEEGNLIKSQMAFAQYLNGFGWVGNLKFLQPPNGYQIKLTKPGVLTYPPKPSNFSGNTVADRGSGDNSQLSYWTVDPTQYEHSMTLIGILDAAGTNGTTATMELGAFAGNEVRGAAPAVYIEPLDAYQFFLTSYANMGGEQLHFKLYDSATGQVQNLVETMYFTPNQHQGSIEDPVLFHLPASGSHTAVQQLSFDVQPNPFHTETLFRFSLPYAQEVALIITDANGREVSSLRTQGVGGLNTLRWNGTSNSGQHLSSGVYFACLRTAEGIANRKVILQR